jgi:hypothetical protein
MIAKALDKPLEVIPARYSAVRAAMAQLHEVPVGWTPKTLANHRSNAKAALLWLAKEKGIPEHGVVLLPCWEELRAKISDSLPRARLSSLMRFCSANHIAPESVDEGVIERLLAYRSQVGQAADPAFRRLLARAWNHNAASTAGWPSRMLVEPPVRAAVALPWEDFPEGLRRDVDQYLESLTRNRRSRTGQRIRPLKPSTIGTRRAELQVAARNRRSCGRPQHSQSARRGRSWRPPGKGARQGLRRHSLLETMVSCPTRWMTSNSRNAPARTEMNANGATSSAPELFCKRPVAQSCL